MVLAISPAGVTLSGGLLPYAHFPARVNSHLKMCPTTPTVETMGAALTAKLIAGTATPAELWSFIRSVFDWGGKTGNRVRGNMQKNYNASFTMIQFAAAASALSAVSAASAPAALQTSLKSSISAINLVHGLSTSYGSKMLRFLRPDISGVFDSVISGYTGFSCDERNFASYAVDCLTVASNLGAAGIVNPRNGTTTWRAGDVDQALFAFCQGW